MKAINLRTEYLENPLGIDIRRPRFYWNCEGGTKQTAYRLVVKRNDSVLWDTGKVSSDRMTHIRYEGQPLESRNRVHWSVTLWDENNIEGEKALAMFEMGLLNAEDWSAAWITGNYKPKKNKRYPVDCFLKEFILSKKVHKARLYITACGLYEAKINGSRVSEFRLAPGTTDYRKRLYYQTYDVTSMLNLPPGGKNKLEIRLADGWFRGSVGAWGFRAIYGRETKILCQLEITYSDGTEETITGDRSFLWSNDGPLRFADLKDGEIYDAALAPSYSSRAKVSSYKITPIASNNVQPKEREILSANLIITPKGKKVLDFGQNIAGIVSFSVNGGKGRRIRLLMGEMLDKDGEFTQANFQLQTPVTEAGIIKELMLISGQGSKLKTPLQPTPKQEIIFTCGGGGMDSYKTAFSVFGFRYVLVETDIEINPADFKAIAVYSAMERTGYFNCSNTKINRLLENTLWSMKGNFLDIPTDCPTRERLGWTGDAQVFFNTGAYLMNTAPLFRKWLGDLRDTQFKTGKPLAVAPYNGNLVMYKTSGGSVGWGDTLVLIPYRYWKRYGDADLLRDFYPAMKQYALYMIKKTGHKKAKAAKSNPYNKYVYEKGFHFGEWLEPEEFKEVIAPGVDVTQFVRIEEATAYLCYVMRHMEEIAGRLGKTDDAALFKEYAEGAKNAYNYLFPAIDTDRQAKLVRPLALGLLEGEKKLAVQKRLATAVENRRYKIGTGFLSTPFVLPVLSEAGFSGLAYKMLENEDIPGWLAEVNAGATTIWEDWEGTVSLNHYANGAVCEWLFDTVGGIRVAGENRFIIAPIPGGALTYADVEYASLYGTIHSKWERTEAGICFTVLIPPNTSAEVVLPNGKTHTVGSGTYAYTVEVKDDK